jgi:hypothetical protein
MRWPGHKLALGVFVTIVAAWAVIMAAVMRQAALPAEASGVMLVVFEPGLSSENAFARIVNAGGRPIAPSAFAFVWVAAGDEPGFAGRLEQEGALGTYRELPLNPTIAGCFAYADAKAVRFLAP